MNVKRVGVFVCRCGRNIAERVDILRVVKALSEYRGVGYAEEDMYLCSESGQAKIANAIKEHKLESIVVAACSPTLHETTFRRLAKSQGLNPYLCEMANIREQCSWVHLDAEKATEKAIRIIKTVVEKVLLDEPLFPLGIPVTKRALVIGAGIAGIQAALDVADAGYEVVIVDKAPSIGGNMAKLSETFPTLDCSMCILSPKMAEVGASQQVRLLTYSEVKEISGYVGNFKVKILKRARYVDPKKCNLCGECEKVCPILVPNEFERGLTYRTAIYMPLAQAVPATYTLDDKACNFCGMCVAVCEPIAIDLEQEHEAEEIEVGAIIVATGYELYPKEKIGEYGYGKYEDVIDGLVFERLLSAGGPTGGVIRRPSDGKVPKVVVFIQCVGSRDEKHLPYCSNICCMSTIKHALLYKHRVPDGQPYIFYMDIRAAGKRYEEFIQRGMEEEVIYVRGRVSRLFKEGDKIMVEGADTLTRRRIEIAADLVVLVTGMTPREESKELIKKLGVPYDEYGFLSEAHPKLRPIESMTSGIYLAGCALAPASITDSVTQASAAASKVQSLFSVKELLHEPIIAKVDEEACGGCGICVSVCPYGALKLDLERKTVEVTSPLCQGCGSCVAACPSGVVQLNNFTDKQILEMVRTALC